MPANHWHLCQLKHRLEAPIPVKCKDYVSQLRYGNTTPWLVATIVGKEYTIAVADESSFFF